MSEHDINRARPGHAAGSPQSDGPQSDDRPWIIGRLSDRMAEQGGFTLIELLVVVQILAILTLIAVPTFLSTAAKARIAVTESNVNSAITASASYYADTVNNATPYTYGGISGSKLRIEAPGVGPNVKAGSKTVATSHDASCIQDSEDGGHTVYHYEGGTGGAATILSGACSAAYSAT
jgi:prepilin-type N-terminal cleavage/methylation domain-containing protein